MLRRTLYGAALLLAWVLAWMLAPWSSKLRAALRLRRGVWQRLRAAALRRDGSRSLIWFHVASAGEFLQAEPLLRRFRERGFQLAVTVLSPSGMRWLERVRSWPEVVWADVLPLDTARAARRLLELLRPAALVYVQADLWPNLLWQAHRLGVPQALVAARLGPRSARGASALGRWFYRDLYGRLQLVLAATEQDARRLERLGVAPPVLGVGGDPGIETVLARVREAVLPPGLAGPLAGPPLLVGGSLWPADAAPLLPVLRPLVQAGALRLILVPHEPTPAHLAELEQALTGLEVRRLSAWQGAAGAPWPAVLLVDEVGKLAGLYHLGHIAYVGGGFSSGVHNVAEPAGAGLPVLFGPRHANSGVAQALLERGAGIAVANRAELERCLRRLLEEPARTRELGRTAQQVVQGLAGAAEETFRALAGLVSPTE